MADAWKKTENMTEDGGKTFFNAEDEIIFGAYFFLSDIQSIHKLSRYDFLAILSHMGGLVNTITLVIGFLMIYYNSVSIASRVVQNLYYFSNDW